MDLTPTLVLPRRGPKGQDVGKYMIRLTIALTKKEQDHLAAHAAVMGMTPEAVIRGSITSVGFEPAWMERPKPRKAG